MTQTSIERAFNLHDGFEQNGPGTYVVTTTPFDGIVRLADETVSVTVRTPMLSAVVESESVADVVEDGWFETLELRLEDAHTVASTDDITSPVIEREGDEAVLSLDFSGYPDKAADDAMAVVDFVEGTWVQGIIPGYEYGDPAAGLLSQARQSHE
ncbi:DUF5813 family protein [Haladaptatus cibarius]|uniref:DUF5813 family protein n=1 Tax=Haladaptatus cibarius TaxID=453847 RepID=UPI0006798608|nr:DUF5813 family protein [Haladaptatus cibarius]